jgi:hypothetical protein
VNFLIIVVMLPFIMLALLSLMPGKRRKRSVRL